MQISHPAATYRSSSSMWHVFAEEEVFFMENTIFSKSYWKSACGEVKKLRMLMFAAICCALTVVIGSLYVMVGDNLRVYFTCFIIAVGCSVYGPVLGALVAAVTDTLNFILFPSGVYFPGYMISEVIAAVIYGAFLYRTRITVVKIYSARMLVNYLCNVLLGSLWSSVLYGKGYLYYLTTSLVKNTLLLPFEAILMALLFSMLIPVFSRFGLMPAHGEKELRKLKLSSSVFTVFGISCILGALCSLYYSTTQERALVFYILSGVLAVGAVGLIVGGILYRRKKLRE